jgi:hypothetical protein
MSGEGAATDEVSTARRAAVHAAVWPTKAPAPRVRVTMLRMNARIAICSAAVFLFAAVALGTFGAHALKARLAPELMATYQTGCPVSLLACARVARRRRAAPAAAR